MENKVYAELREPATELTIADKMSRDAAALTPADLLEAVGVKNPAALLEKYPDGTLTAATLDDLCRLCGVKAGRVLFAALRLADKIAARAGMFLKPRDVWEELRDIREHKKEHFVVFFLDTRNREIKRDVVSIGTLNYNLVHPREVFAPAIQNLAASVIVAHNHPSGCLEPSDEDISLTKRLVEAGKLLGIQVLDHIIVTREGFLSFKEKGMLGS